MRTFINSLPWIFAFLLLLLCGCVGPTLRGSEQAISDRYPEAEVFYLTTDRVVPDDGHSYLPLLPVSQGLDRATPIEEGAAVTVLAQCVRLPADAPKHIDAVVVLDVRVVGSNNATEPVIVGYFPAAQPGQRLTFQSLRVFGTDTWDPRFPLEFRVRVFDWREKQNERIITAIEQAEQIAKKLSAGVLGLSDPIVHTAVNAASDLIRHRPNVAIIDFKVGMYSARQVQATAGRIPLLRQGSWLVAAKPKDTTPEYWMRSFAFAEPGQAIFSLRDGRLADRLDLPFLEVAVGQFATQPGRSRLLEEVSNVLVDVGSAKWENDPDAVARSSFSLASTASRIVAVRQFEEAREDQTRKDAFRRLFEMLSDPNGLQAMDRTVLLSYVRSRVGETPLPSESTALETWWREYGDEGSIGTDGLWVSPIGGWVRDLRSPAPGADFRQLSGKLMPRLVQALRPSSSKAEPDEAATSPKSKPLNVGPGERETIVNFFEYIRRSSSRIEPLDTAERVIAWWEAHGRYGELRISPQGPYWYSFPELVAERLEAQRANQVDFCYAVSAIVQKPMSITLTDKPDPDLSTVISLTKDSEADRSRLLLALRKSLPGYPLNSTREVEEWWTGLGVDGDFTRGTWESPVLATVTRYLASPSIVDFEKLARWTEARVLSQSDADAIPRDGLLMSREGNSGPFESTFESVRAWIAVAKRARQSFIDHKVPADDGNGIKEFMPGWRVESTRNQLSREALFRMLLLRQAYVDAPPSYVGRTAGILTIDTFLNQRVKGPVKVPTQDQREAFLSGRAVGEGANATWNWELPQQ